MTEPTNNTNKGKHRVSLSFPQMFALTNWLLGMKDWLENDRPQLQEVTQLAASKIGFAVSKTNVRTCIRTAEIKWRPRMRRVNYSSLRGSRGRFIMLLSAVETLYARLGETQPDCLKQLLQEAREKLQRDAGESDESGESGATPELLQDVTPKPGFPLIYGDKK